MTVGKMIMTIFMIIFVAVTLPEILNSVQRIGGIDPGEPSPGSSIIIEEVSIMAKRVEYKRGLFGLKESFVLILSDGESYKVPEAVFLAYDTGDLITVRIERGRVTLG